MLTPERREPFAAQGRRARAEGPEIGSEADDDEVAARTPPAACEVGAEALAAAEAEDAAEAADLERLQQEEAWVALASRMVGAAAARAAAEFSALKDDALSEPAAHPSSALQPPVEPTQRPAVMQKQEARRAATLAAVYVRWAEHTAEVRGRRYVLSNAVSRLARRQLSGAFLRWAEHVVELQWQRRIAMRAVERMAQRPLARRAV